MSDAVREAIDQAKLKHRTSLSLDDWCSSKYFEKQNEVCDRILRGEDPDFRDTIERIHVDDYSFEEFIEKYEKGSKPVIIQGVVD